MIMQLIKYRELLANLVIRTLKVRYKGSVLGFFWSLLDPLLMMLVYLIFIKLMRFSIDLPVLFVGVVAWQFFVMCVNDGVGIITGNTNLVKKVYFPRVILPMAMSIANFINFLLSIGVLLVLLLFFGISINKFIFLFPVVVIFHFLLCFGVALFVSCSNVFFRDTEHLVSVVLMMLFFMSPIIYPVSIVPERLLFLYFLNPMSSIITLYRGIFLDAEIPSVSSLYLSGGMIILIFVVSYMIFSHFQRYFADEL